MNPLDEIKPALLAEIDVDERHVGPQVLDTLQPFRRGRRHRHHADSLMLEQPCRRIEEIAVVVDNDATRPLTNCHEFSLGNSEPIAWKLAGNLCRVGKDWRAAAVADRR